MVEIIAIDGPASSGKSTLAKKISSNFDSPILYSGRLYRAVAYEIIKKKIDVSDKNSILHSAKSLDKIKLNSKKLYSSEIDKLSSIISAKKYLRDELKQYQRNFPINFAKNKKFAIIEGRDIGTLIFPDAKYKIFMWAEAKIRARRRFDQIRKKGEKASLNRIYKEIVARDKKDLSRKIAPLKPAVNSLLLDTTYLDIEQAFNVIERLIKK
jgi:cytidylate kinase